MTSCGICVSAESTYKCSLCDVQICGKCCYIYKYIFVCRLCINSLNIIKPYIHWFCSYCDTCVSRADFHWEGKCVKCFDKKTTIKNRLLLPHFKARPIIETQFIPDIAQLIFDYYYNPRRYYEGEE